MSFFCIASLYAREGSATTDSPLKPENFSIPETDKNNRNADKVDDLKVNEFYLNIDSKSLKEVQSKHKENKHLLDGFDNISINQKPVVKSISSTDTIAMHPYFTTTILLPKGSVISYASGKMFNSIKHSQNMLTVDIANDFDRGNLVVVYSEKEQNKILNVLVKKFDKNEIKSEVLNTVYSYVNVPELSNIEVIQAFIKEYGRYPQKKYEYLYVGDMVYRIVTDDKYGDVFVKGKKYRIDRDIVQK